MRVVRDELRYLRQWSDRHRVLIARLSIIAVLTLAVAVVGSVLTWMFERDAANTDIHTYGDALFFTLVQLLTVSSQIRNPFTTAGRVVEYVDHLHEHFVDPCVVRGGRYVLPEAPGYSIEMREDSLSRFEFPTGSAWAARRTSSPSA